MASDDAKSEKDKDEKQSHWVKAGAALFATVIAPVLLAMGMKFNDVIFSRFEAKPPEAAKADPAKPVETPAKSEPPKSEPSKPEVVQSPPAAPATTPVANATVASAPPADSGSATMKVGQKNRKGARTNDPEKPHASAVYTSIFNGRDLSGWESPPSDLERWSVNASTLTGEVSGAKKKRTWLFSSRDYSDFRLRFEFRMDPETESGIAFRTVPQFNVGKDNGRIALLLSNGAKEPIPSGALVSWGGGVAHRLFDPKAVVSLRPAKDWNVAEIEFRGSHLHVEINGQTVQDASVDQSAGLQRTGRLALDCRSGHVEFQKIEIQELH